MAGPELHDMERAEENERGYFGLLAETPPVEDAAVLINPVCPALLINRAMSLHLTDHNLDADLARVERPFRDYRIYPSFYLTPNTRPANLRATLLHRGYHVEYRQTVMAYPALDRLGAVPPDPPGLQIVTTTDPASYQAWCQTFLVGFDVPRELRAVMYEMNLRSLRHPQVTGLVGVLDGKPVATTCLYMHGDTAGLYAVSTVPRARRRGVAAALVRRALQIGASKGANLGVLQTANGGDPERLYRSLGFQELFVAEVLTHYGLLT